MTTLASPKIVFSRTEISPELSDMFRKVATEIHKVRCQGFNSATFYRHEPNGDFNIKTLGNKLLRSSKHMNYYFADPVIINYNNAIESTNKLDVIGKLRYTNVGRVLWVDLNPDGDYELSLFINRNTDFSLHENITLVEEMA